VLNGSGYDSVCKTCEYTGDNELAATQILPKRPAIAGHSILLSKKAFHVFYHTELDRYTDTDAQQWRQCSLLQNCVNFWMLTYENMWCRIRHLVKCERPFVLQNAPGAVHHTLVCALGRRLHTLKQILDLIY
jgi:hypothetical protein